MKTIGICAALALLLSSTARAEDCGPLKIVGQADMLSTEGALLVPGAVNGHPIKVVFDTGGWFLELSPTLVKTLDLPVEKRSFGLLDITGHVSNKTTTVSDFEIGTFKAKNVSFLIPENDYGGEIDGIMGPKLIQVVDVDLDFGGKKINFLLQDHCEGKVVYWKTPSYAVVPFVLTDEGHIRFPIVLDGQKFTALLDTGAGRSLITNRAAQMAFGITTDSPGVTKAGFVNGDKNVQQYERTFKTLTIGGITFNNPKLNMVPDLMRIHLINAHKPPINSHIDTNNEAEGLDDVVVGLEELRQLHIYIAYKEQKLYISPSDAPAPPPAAEQSPLPPASGAPH